MKSYQYRILPKHPGTEVNIARILQPIDFSQCKVEIEETKTVQDEKKHEGPRKSSVSVSSRRSKKDEKISEYTLKCMNNEKAKSWQGKSDESSKYAILIFDGTEVRVVLTDHWYKFSPIFSAVNLEVDSELKLGKVKRQREDAQLVKEVIGEDSDEDKTKKKIRVERKPREDDANKEGMDFNEEFDDDEEAIDEEEELEEAALQHGLSNSGKELQKILIDKKSESLSESGDSSDIGLSDDESSREGINKQAVINELMRLGRTTLKDLISECTKKFKYQNNLKILLSDIIRDVAEISGTGENSEVVLKDEYKRVMPSFGVRIHFQTNKK